MSAELSMSYHDADEPESKSLADYLEMARRRKKPMLFTGVLVFAIAVLVAILMPPTYRSSATILIEEQEIPEEMVQSTITVYVDQQIQVLSQRVMTQEKIMGIVQKFGVYSPEDLARMPRSQVADAFRASVTLDVISTEIPTSRYGQEATTAFSLSYDSPDPQMAQRVTNELVDLYLSENLRIRAEKTGSTEEFLRQETEALAKELSEIENQIAEFKNRNKDSLPGSLQYNVQNLSRLESQALTQQSRLRELNKREMELTSRLAQTSPYSPTVLPTGETVLADVDRLKALQSEYRKKAATYNVNHPDIKKLNREIDALSATIGHAGNQDDLRRLLKDRKSELAQLQKTYSSNHPDVIAKDNLVAQLEAQLTMSKSGAPSAAADNPAYIFLDNQLSGVRMEKVGLRLEMENIARQIEELNNSVAVGPSIEKEYAELERSQQATQSKYMELKSKLSAAELAGALEVDRKGQRFVLLEPPAYPEAPLKPNRRALVVLGAVLAAFAALALMLLLEALDSSLRSEKALTALAGFAPLVSIPYIATPREQARLKPQIRLLLYLVFSLVMILAVVWAVDKFYKPLDVLWFTLQRKLGIG